MALLAAAVMMTLLMATQINGQIRKTQWAPEEMYNPLTEPRKCGHKSESPAFVCDPNSILGEHLESFNWILKDAAYNSTRCPCSNYYCENQAGPTGYRIGLALVKKMTMQTNPEGQRNQPKDQAQLFAYRLESDLWNMGNCEEDIIIFYSVEDGMLSLFGGSTAIKRLTKEKRELLAYRVGSRFQEGRIVEALNNLIYDLKIVLNCDSELQAKGVDCGLHELRDSSVSVVASIAVISVALLASLYNVLH